MTAGPRTQERAGGLVASRPHVAAASGASLERTPARRGPTSGRSAGRRVDPVTLSDDSTFYIQLTLASPAQHGTTV